MPAHEILIVDDSTTMRRLVRAALEPTGHSIHEACDGKDALARLETFTPKLVITDVNMPEMDGLALVRALRARTDLPRIPILVLTTVTDQAMKDEGRKAGATGWICKPFQPETLRTVVQTVLAR